MSFYVGQVFIAEYPPEAAIWCNSQQVSGAYIEEIERSITGQRRFQIKQLPVATIDEVKESLIAEIKTAFNEASEDAHCMSSVGFEINAGSVAKRDIDGLIEKLEYSGQETEMFRAYDNSFHQVTVDQLKAMRIDVIDNANALYKRKWQLEAHINACTTVDELNAIDIDFEV